jgi:hypothetical protein
VKVILIRKKRFVWDDPMHRCYNGAFGEHHFEYGEWEIFETLDEKENPEERLKFWQEMNDYAVSFRGDSAKAEYKIGETIEDEKT